MNVREILVATDFSEIADAAVRVAREHAERWGARVHLLHVSSLEDLELSALLARSTAQLGPAVPVVVASAVGDPAEAILRYAQARGIDLIIVGTHGRSGVTRLLLGSVAERVVRHAPCPVLTVPLLAGRPATTTSLPAIASVARCVVCASASADLICEPCRARIRGEALERKQREERAGRL